MKKVKVVDYDAGNLFNVVRAFEYLECETRLVRQADEIHGADYLVLPGVGAFADGMASLHQRELVQPIIDWAESGKPLIGICLGMQLLLSSSEEFGQHEGLNIVPGRVRRLPTQPGMKVPNIGWHPLQPSADDVCWDKGCLRDISREQDMYFVHSFAAYPDDQAHWLARSAFGEHWFCSVLEKDNIFACQFHPEKSGEVGLNILRRYISQ